MSGWRGRQNQWDDEGHHANRRQLNAYNSKQNVKDVEEDWDNVPTQQLESAKKFQETRVQEDQSNSCSNWRCPESSQYQRVETMTFCQSRQTNNLPKSRGRGTRPMPRHETDDHDQQGAGRTSDNWSHSEQGSDNWGQPGGKRGQSDRNSASDWGQSDKNSTSNWGHSDRSSANNWGHSDRSNANNRGQSDKNSANNWGQSDRNSAEKWNRPGDRSLDKWDQQNFSSHERSQTSAEEHFGNSLEIKIPSKSIGIVIGKGGANIRQLQEKSNAKIHLDKNINEDGMVSIRMEGDSYAQLNAKKLIEELIALELNRDKNSGYQENRGNFSDTYNLEVPSEFVGKIIGKGGSTISDLQVRSGARIKVSRDNSGLSTMIAISGSEEARKSAEDLINELIADVNSRNFGNDNKGQKSAFESSQDQTSNNFSEDGIRASNSSRSQPSSDRNCTNSAVVSKTSGGSNVIDWDKIRQGNDEYQEIKWKEFPPIKKDFYIEDEDVANLDPREIEQIRKENNNIMVQRLNSNCNGRIPNPIRTFAEAFGHYPEIMEELKKAGFEKPSPIQMQAWPIILQGHDLIGIAQTGTGKTLAFLLPAFIHIEGQQADRDKRGGANILVLTPTRELALQIEEEVKKYKYKDIKCVCVYGGGNRREQINIVTSGVEIIIATPGRLIDLIQNKIVDVKSVTYLVLDEADRMLDLGFQPDIRKILLDIRPQRQTIMTSATWPTGVRYMATNYMNDPFQVFVGSMDLTACHSVLQRVLMVDEDDKMEKLVDILQNEIGENDKVIVFMSRKSTVDYVSTQFVMREIECQSIHGSREQYDREQALSDLKSGAVRVLLATDVASRGIDIKDVTYVINYDFPHDIEEYVHRVGRTGRAGKNGQSITFIARNDWRYAKSLIGIMEEAKQEVPQTLYDMASRFEVARERRQRERGGFHGNRGGDGDFFDNFRGSRSGRGNRRNDKNSFGFSVGYM